MLGSMNRSFLLLAALLVALVLVGSAAGRTFFATTDAATAAEPWLYSYPYSTAPGARAELDLTLWLPRLDAAKVTLLVPGGYGMRIDQPPGTDVGLAGGRDGGSVIGPSSITTKNPDQYLTDAGAQACAPGRHAAVWSFELRPLGTATYKIPILIDPQDSGYELQLCLPQPKAQTFGLEGLELDFESVFTNPTTNGAYDWRAIVAPATASGEPDAAGAYEVRSLIGIPSAVTLSGRYDKRTKQAVLTGRFVAPGIDVGATPVSLYEFDPDEHLSPWSFVRWHRTSADGSFTFRRRIARSTKFGVRVESIGDCSSTPPAQLPCENETLADVASRVVTVRKR
jgi:hypothetical protein